MTFLRRNFTLICKVIALHIKRSRPENEEVVSYMRLIAVSVISTSSFDFNSMLLITCNIHLSWKDNDLRVAMVGKEVDLSYEYEVRRHLDLTSVSL